MTGIVVVGIGVVVAGIGFVVVGTGIVVVGIVDWVNGGAVVVAAGEEHPTASNDRITSEINKNFT